MESCEQTTMVMRGYRVVIWIFACCLGSISSGCEKDTETICENLLKQGISDSTSLQGDWEFKHFAKTLNGSNIYNMEAITSDKLIGFEDNQINGGVCNAWLGEYSLYNGNGISIGVSAITYMMCEADVNELEARLLKALGNSKCYVIKNNELILHFTGDTEENIVIMAKH